jgi:hydroxylamine reductase (hybrid-cluster protein)
VQRLLLLGCHRPEAEGSLRPRRYKPCAIAYNIAWYEQKAVIVLLALLYLGVKNIHLGPTLPAFLSPNVAKVLVETFGIAGIGTVEDDIDLFLK